MVDTPESRATSVPADEDGMVQGEITHEQLRVGFKVYVEKDGEQRRAEILSVQQKKSGKLYYVHYEEFNKRLDEFVTLDRVDLTKPVEIPTEKKKKQPPVSEERQSKVSKVGKKTDVNKKSKNSKNRKSKAGGKENDESAARELLGDGEMDLDQVHPNAGQEGGFNREEEIEKLRTSGSMTQNSHEVARVRNLSKVVMGDSEIEPWYFSPYPVELAEEDVVYIDEFTLSYFGSKKQFDRFRSKNTLKHPPGNEIYRDGNISFFEVDGRRQRTWGRNLCLFAKLFLDHKTLYYDVDPFLFYCMTVRDERGHHLVGYFSKEKESTDQNNVACILTLPQYQRHGYGRVLIDFSYNLSKKENKQGSPEKPLSDLGLLSYRAYWTSVIIELLVEAEKGEMTIEDIANKTAMSTTDILHTMQTMNMLKYYKGQHIICLTQVAVDKYEQSKKKNRIRIDPDKLIWKPPIFAPSQLRFPW